jgi:putative phosphoribosyl transferase
MKEHTRHAMGLQALFIDRLDAGRQLADRLANYRGQDALVLGIPRGGVPVAAEVARLLGAELDVVVARKLGAPHSPELAIGAVTANGGRYLSEDLIREIGINESYIDRVTDKERDEAARRQKRFRGGEPAPRIADRVVIVVDDGLATGATMHAAVRSIRVGQPGRLVVAVPVGSFEACAALQDEADEVVCLYKPEPFWAVGLYYDDFRPTEDETVEEILSGMRALRGERLLLPM